MTATADGNDHDNDHNAGRASGDESTPSRVPDPHQNRVGAAFDWGAIGWGAALTLVLVVPADLAKRGVSSGSSWNGLFFAFVLVAFGLGGALAGRTSPRRYLTVGAITGLVAVAAYLVIGVLARVASGDPIKWASLIFTGLLGACCGMLGADVGARWHRRHTSGAAS